jgi:4-hydroxy-tetrahydrodipicolinate reductase
MGLGFIGQEIARVALQSEELELIGAVDKSPSLAGKKLTDVLGMAAGTFKISATLSQAVQRRTGVVLLHATGSRLPQVTDQVLEALSHGMHVVSTCEELAFPYFHHPALAEKIDRAAQRASCSIAWWPPWARCAAPFAACAPCGPSTRSSAARPCSGGSARA